MDSRFSGLFTSFRRDLRKRLNVIEFHKNGIDLERLRIGLLDSSVGNDARPRSCSAHRPSRPRRGHQDAEIDLRHSFDSTNGRNTDKRIPVEVPDRRT